MEHQIIITLDEYNDLMSLKERLDKWEAEGKSDKLYIVTRTFRAGDGVVKVRNVILNPSETDSEYQRKIEELERNIEDVKTSYRGMFDRFSKQQPKKSWF